jgi:hypothetical protein
LRRPRAERTAGKAENSCKLIDAPLVPLTVLAMFNSRFPVFVRANISADVLLISPSVVGFNPADKVFQRNHQFAGPD